MALGDSPFLKVASDMQQVWNAQSITIALVSSQAASQVPRDRFGHPTGTVASVNVQIVLDRVTEDIKQTPEGGQPIEQLQFFAVPGTVNENDQITWAAHQFRVNSVWPSTFGGTIPVSFCKANRMVGT